MTRARENALKIVKYRLGSAHIKLKLLERQHENTLYKVRHGHISNLISKYNH